MTKNKILICSLIASSLLLSGCKDDFADLNKDDSKVDPTVPFLFTKALVNLDPGRYTAWLYNNNTYYLPWVQATASSSGNDPRMNEMGAFFAQETQLIEVKSAVEDIKTKIRSMSEFDAAKYKYVEAMANTMTVYTGLFGTDSYGSMAYTDVAMTEPVLRPEYQTQAELIDLWLNELDNTIKTLSNPIMLGSDKVPQISVGVQDFVYNGNVDKWLKFANSLKLKLAVRLINTDKPKALKIASEVANSSAGVMDGLSDDFIWNPGSQYYHFGDAVVGSPGTETLINFLVQNQDPRVRFLFKKNGFNSKIVSQFVAEGRSLPFYIDQYVDYKIDGDGKKQFGGWKAPGEPWVRYHGVPVDFQAKDDSKMIAAYYNTDNFKLRKGDKSITYSPYSNYNEEMVRGGVTHLYPALPGEEPVKDDTKQAYYGAYLSTAEVNLYLAEFKLLGANVPGSADSYYKKAIEMSVRLLDRLADKNKIPYYAQSNPGYASDEVSIGLKEAELAHLLSQPAYQLTGSPAEQLEKVYIQQYIHFLYIPNDLFVTVRRSGIPMQNSKILPRLDFDKGNPDYVIPRRLKVDAISPTDMLGAIKAAAYKEEGFTAGTNNPVILWKERLWYDKQAPEFGAGPKL